VAQTKELKRRIRSVENTRKITRTMEMVATSKMKKATDRVRAARPYGQALGEIVRSLHAPGLEEHFPVLRQPTNPRRVAILLLTANRGLAGGFNANLIKEGKALYERLEAEGVEVELHVAGKKGISFFRFRGVPMETTTTDIGDTPGNDDAGTLVDPLVDAFVDGRVDAVYVVSSEFVSALSTPPQTTELLPIRAPEGASSADSFILSPQGELMLDRLLPAYLRNVVYRALVENAAAEQGARRTAMKAATDNAGDMLENLTRTYNRARQQQITQEIAEIVGGAAALE
jgi:F-type H+-transporting ATPase subunit gamma